MGSQEPGRNGANNGPGVPDTDGTENMARGRKGRRAVLIAVLLTLLLACGVGYFLYIYDGGGEYLFTDNARVTAKMYTITPHAAGELVEWRAQEGQKVAKDDILGRLPVLPYITAPIDGTLVKNDAVEGQMVSPGTPLAVVADTDHLYIGVNIEETDIAQVREGQAVDVQIDAYPGRVFPGVVAEISPTTQTYFSSPMSFSTSGTYNKVTQLIPVKVVVEHENDLPLTFGMNATVKIHLTGAPAEIAAGWKTPGTEAAPALEYSGFIQPGTQVEVAPNIAGKVAAVNVDVGQKVARGAVLFVLDSADAGLQVRQAEAGVVPAQIAFDEAAASYARLETLFAQGALAQAELDSARTKMDTAAAQLENARIALQIAQKKLADCTVTAPIAGEIAATRIAAGGMASPQAPAIALVNTDSVLVRGSVTETNISRVRVGAQAQVRVPAINAVTEGTVTVIAPASDPQTGMFAVEIRVDNPRGTLRPGMAADVKLPPQVD